MRSVRVLALLALASVLVPAAGSGGEASPPPPAQAIVVPTGPGPCGIASRTGSLWLGIYSTGTLLRIDGRGRVEARLPVGATPCRVAAGPAAVWVTLDRPGELVRVALGSGRRRHVPVGRGAFDVVLARGSAWVTSFEVGTVTRIDARTGRSTRVYKVGANPAGLAFCGDRIWVGHGRTATWLTEIDAQTNRIRRVDVGTPAPGWPRCVQNELWVTAPGQVLRVNASNGDVMGRLELGGTPAEAAAGSDGLAWITDKERSLVFRVDRKLVSIVDSFPAGPGAYALARLGTSMWVTSFAGTDVRRFDP
jgi:streptogramin lyase